MRCRYPLHRGSRSPFTVPSNPLLRCRTGGAASPHVGRGLPAEVERRRCLDPAVTWKGQLVKAWLRGLVAIHPANFRPRTCHVGSSGTTARQGILRRLARLRGLRHSALVHAWVPGTSKALYGEVGVGEGTAAVAGMWRRVLGLTGIPWERVVAIWGAAADARQKIVLRVVDSKGQAVAFMKLGLSGLAAAKVRHEAEMLRNLSSGLAPRLLTAGPCGDGHALVVAQLPVAGPCVPRLPPGHQRLPPAWRRLESLLRGMETCRLHAVSAHPALTRLAATGVDVAPWAGLLGERDWPETVANGDLAPWNVYVSKDGLELIDWEDGSLDALPGWDAAGLVMQTAFFVHRWPPARAAAYAVDWFRRMGYESDHARGLVGSGAMAAWACARESRIPDGHDVQLYRQAVAAWVLEP